jgi:hypothetical protein
MTNQARAFGTPAEVLRVLSRADLPNRAHSVPSRCIECQRCSFPVIWPLFGATVAGTLSTK